jgi:hypothetical protein
LSNPTTNQKSTSRVVAVAATLKKTRQGDRRHTASGMAAPSVGSSEHPWGATIMENLSKRTTAIVAVCFLLFALGWGYGWQKVAQVSNPPVHCDYHFQHITCTPVGKAA